MSAAVTGQATTDVTRQYPELSPVPEAVARRDWSAVFKIVAGVEPALQFLAARRIGELLDDAGVVEVDTAAAGTEVMPKMIAGAALIELGWAIRTGARAKQVSREQFGAFHDCLRRAEQRLIEVTAHEPSNACAWTLRLLTARGLELGHNEARRRYIHAVAAVPHFYSAQVQLLQQLCPKWSGTWEDMHTFARECAFAAPPGSVNGAMVVDGHIERWLDLDGGSKGAAYLSQPAVQQEVIQAAGHSVLHPSFRLGTPGWVWAHNAFAMYWCLVGNNAAAAMHFRAAGDFAHEFPWAYQGDPAATFQRYRQQSLVKG